MAKDLIILRVDPVKRIVASMRMRAGGGNLAPEVARICRVKEVGHRVLMDVDHESIMREVVDAATRKPTKIESRSTKLIVAAGAQIADEMPSWRLKGGDGTSGIGILFGIGPGGGMVDCPVTADWLRRLIVWEDGETPEMTRDHAVQILPLLDEEARAVLEAATPQADGLMFIPLGCRNDVVMAVLRAHGLMEDETALLTALGTAAHFALVGEA